MWHHVGHNRVGRLMRKAGLVGVTRRRECWTTVRDRGVQPAPDLVRRDFVADAPNQLWVADITYIPTWSGFLYLAVVLDVFSRRIVGWSMANHLRTELIPRRPRDGDRTAQAGERDPSFGPGLPIHFARVRFSVS